LRAEGKVNWKTVVENFYPDLKEAIDKAENELEKVTIHDEVTDCSSTIVGNDSFIIEFTTSPISVT